MGLMSCCMGWVVFIYAVVSSLSAFFDYLHSTRTRRHTRSASLVSLAFDSGRGVSFTSRADLSSVPCCGFHTSIVPVNRRKIFTRNSHSIRFRDSIP
jgi:hypothetical protein